jgi:hypothetical protein
MIHPMDWIAAFFRWLFALPLTQQMRAMAYAHIAAILEDLDRFPEGSLHPEDEAYLLHELARALDTAHNCLSGFIHYRSLELIGRPVAHPRVKAGKPRNRIPTRDTLLRRVDELITRLERSDALAHQRATQLGNFPLRLGASHQATSPAFAVEATLASRAISCLHRQSRGRWIARSCARDGGGGPRAPPRHISSDPILQREIALHLALARAEIAPARIHHNTARATTR